jgi:sugar O-acyltransferase (sialic acid O-acetyltransferase NeuD family)
MNEKLIIFGNGEFGSMANYYFKNSKTSYFCVDDNYVKESNFEGIPIIPYSELLNIKLKNDYKVFVALSYKNMNKVREAKYKQIKKLGFTFTSFIHKSSYISDKATIGENCLILENQTIQKNVIIKNNVFLWSGNHVGHNSIIDDNTYLSSHVVISGDCKVGKNCFFGVNSSVKDSVIIKDEVLIGMGASVTKNIAEGSVVINNNSTIYDKNSKVSKFLKI